MASAATPDVTVLSVKLAKPQRERVRKLRQGQVDHVSPRVSGYIKKEKDVTDTVGRQEVKQELAKDAKKEPEEVTVEVKKEVKQEVERQMQKEVAGVTHSKLSLDVKEEVKSETCKVEVKEERGTDKGKKVKEESRVDAKEEVKDEVKEEVMEDAKQVKTEVKDEGMEEMALEIKSAVKQEVKREIKREDLTWNRQTIRVKQECVEEAQRTCSVKQEAAEEAGSVRPSKRRRISHKRPDISPPSFESRLPEWAEKCLAFQSSGKTWLPTKPCCPASPFLGLAAAPWEGCEEDRTVPCVQRLGKVQFCEFRDFFHENPHHALFNDHGKDSSGSGPLEKVHCPRPGHFQDPAAKQHRAAEMMKMWPWMHDLPTRAWAGHGWLVEEDGMRRLSPTGGGSAMKGLEIFEAFGTVPEESQEAAGASAPSSSGATGQVITRSFRGLERQSGVQGICWNRQMSCWRVRVQEAGKGRMIQFFISKHMREGLSEDEAVAAALAEAKAHREELVRQGKLKPPKPGTAKASGSAVRGITLDKRNGTFQVRITHPRTKKKEEGGTFKTLAEAEAKARELAKKLGLQAEGEVVPVDRLAEAPHFEPLGPEPGVRWILGEKGWRARTTVGGKERNMRFRPKDFSEKEVEKAWKQAVAWRKQQEKERERPEKGQKR